MASNSACDHGDGDRRNRHPVALLSSLCGNVRLSEIGREVPADVSRHSGTRPALGRGAVSVDAKDRNGGSFRRERGASLSAILGTNSGAFGLSKTVAAQTAIQAYQAAQGRRRYRTILLPELSTPPPRVPHLPPSKSQSRLEPLTRGGRDPAIPLRRDERNTP